MSVQKLAPEEEMPKAYDPKPVEAKWYEFWRQQGYFTPQIDPTKTPFVIIMPPPNVTGELHLGHALTATLEDIMVRWHRMRGEPTLWLPGIDHAGIAGQNVVEQWIAQEGLTRHDLGREKFLERVWEWMRKYGRIIAEQHQQLGASCDWTRERFTMDEGPSRAVRTTFVNLYHKGLIYRGERLINWCPRCATALSDLEVDHEDVLGSLYYVKYPLEGERGEEFIAVATTRPETILGDSGVAVHPGDARHQPLVGRRAILPLLGRLIPIVADAAVDPNFGTGAVKITPAHDPLDFEIGLRHNLPPLVVMNPDATMNEAAGPFAGLDRYACRRSLLEYLEKEELLLKVEPHVHSVGHCARCQTVVEPLLSEQWFVDIKPLAKPAMEAVLDGYIRIVPERFVKVYLNWMENIRDWCISRQLWWGHRIPVWYCRDCGGSTVTVEDPSACASCSSPNIEQDPDVLDTWFSSALWPHSTLGWPQESGDFRYFYPTTVMETGYDILFFWVARMIMMGLENTGQVPFHRVYLHGLVRDEKGEKMSKSRGNVINPVEAMDEYGTDALRFSLSTGSTPGNDLKLSAQRLAASRNFANKLWNASRFVMSCQAPPEKATTPLPLADSQPLLDGWIVSRLNRLIASVNEAMEAFQFGEAERQIHDFLWGEFCDWYIEIAKIRLRPKGRRREASPLPLLVHVLETSLRLLHPFMPFLTEEIWQRLTQRFPQYCGTPAASIMIAPYPQADEAALDIKAEWQMGLLMETVRAIRNLRAEHNVEVSRWIEALLVAEEAQGLLESHAEVISHLARLRPLTILETLEPKPQQALTAVAADVQIYIPLAGMLDIPAERRRLQRALAKLQEEIQSAERKLADAQFLQKAPITVVQKEQARLKDAQQRLGLLRERLEALP